MEKAMILVSVLLLGWTRTLQGVPVDGDQVVPTAALAVVEEATLLKAPLFNAIELCEQKPPTYGITCWGYFPRYFYNSSSMSCQRFIYGGCGGNENNFKTKKECMERCNTEEVCEQPPETGPCDGFFPRYFYNSSSMSCQLFIYGGCGGNQNNFETETGCMERCHPEDVEDPLSNTTLNLPNTFVFNATEVCKKTPETGPCKAHTPRYFYNSSSMSCQLFIYGGCEGNQNNFETEKTCMEICGAEEVCEQPPETGPCRAYIPRYFYNSSSMSCQLFTYGGCMGNQNNFETENGCMRRCNTEEVCEQPSETGLCKAHIPRYFYNSSSMSCQLFVYGGCEGNQNNFKTEEGCMRRCHAE